MAADAAPGRSDEVPGPISGEPASARASRGERAIYPRGWSDHSGAGALRTGLAEGRLSWHGRRLGTSRRRLSSSALLSWA